MKGGEKMKRFIFLTCIISLLFGMGCEENKQVVITEKVKNDFAGIVIDSVTLQPLDSVSIYFIDTIGSPFTYSDSIGQFVDIYIGGENIEIIAKKEGYITKSQQIDLRLNPDSILFELVKQ